ncbi:hypothetical protein QYE76_069389 [Lolium multiflorum]|uniref:Retrotransposon gag domain-containing protein n=1 Tax=Lolium multiflorum TaxID=4521 RepID=A0AAD8SGP3_LOLMU|nr:hypothetical protein QYE76_069389 [Lolium multiflorum]
MVPKRRAIGYSKPYPDDYEMIPLPPKYRLDFSKFSGSDGSSSIEHVGRYLAQLGPASVSDQLRVRLFSQSLTGSAFGWYTSLPPDSIRTWKQLEEQFHMQYHSEASESGIADLAQLRQKRGETVDTQPFPAVNMVECTYPEGCQPGSSFSINMVGPGHHSAKMETRRPLSKDTEEAAPRDRLRHDGKRYVTEGEVKNIRYQRPLSDHLLNKYVSQYDQHRRSSDDDERDRLARETRRHRRHDHDEEEHERRAKGESREQDDNDSRDCPFFRHAGIQE